MNKTLALALFSLITLWGHPASGALRTWTGGGSDNLWSNPDNWGGFTIAANDRLTFAGSTNLNTFNDLASGTSFEQINFAAGAGSFVLEGNDIRLTISVSSNGVIEPQFIKLNYEVTSATNYGYGVLLQVDGNISGAGGTAVVNGGIVRLTGANTYTGISKVDNGTLIVDSIGNVGGGGSNLGAPTTSANGTITLGAATGTGVLSYMGAGENTDRVVNLGGTTGGARLNQAGTGLLKFTSDFTATGAGNKILTLQGSTVGTGEIAGAIVDSTGTTALVKNGSGTWTLSGSNTFTGNTTLSSGTLKLDYSTNSGSKLSDTGVLALNGGTLELSGGSHTEAVASTTLNTGGTFVKQTAGTSKLALGAITFTGGAIDFGAANIAITTTGNTNGILSQRATVAGADFASNDGSNNIVAYTGYTSFGGSMVANTNYSLAGSSSLSGATGAATNTLKIAPASGGQSLTVGGNTLTLGALLFTGSEDFTITTTGANRLAVASLLNYGSGDLYYGSIGATGLTQYGTGRTILTEGTTTNGNLVINGGFVQFSANDQLANPGSNRNVTLNGGALVADTTGGAIALNNSGLNSRTFTLNEGGGIIDVIGGNSLTVSGIIAGAVGGPLTLGSTSSNGTIFLTGANNYLGTTILRGGTINLGVAENVNSNGPLGSSRGANPGSILLNGGILQYSAANQFDYSGRFGTIGGQQYNVDTNGQNVTWGTALVSADGSLTKSGSGSLTLTAANTYSGTTAISAGTLILSGQGSIANSAAIDLESGGTLDVAGVVGGFSLADGQTLRGSGSVIGDVTLSSGSTLSIGNSPGTMTFSDDLTLSGGSISDFEIDGLTAGFFDLAQGDVGSQTVTFGGTLNLLFQAGFNTIGSVKIFDFENYAGSFAVTNISGLAGGYSATFDELTGTVTVSVIPEPSTWLLVLGGLSMVTALRRRLR